MNSMEMGDFLILLLNEFNGTVESETRIQKLTFLTEQESDFDFGVKFKWWHYGPYSKDVNKCLQSLDQRGIIKMSEKERTTFMGDTYTIKIFKLTARGRAKVENIRDKISNQVIDIIRSMTKQYGFKPLKDLLSYVYTSYSPSDL
jgi:uncharacterized protein YwgA